MLFSPPRGGMIMELAAGCKAEGRRQKAEGRRQKAEGRRQKAEGKKGAA
jgi:hypothetical protein